MGEITTNCKNETSKPIRKPIIMAFLMVAIIASFFASFPETRRDMAMALPDILSGAVFGIAFPVLAFYIFQGTGILTFKKREHLKARIAKLVNRNALPGAGLTQYFKRQKEIERPALADASRIREAHSIARIATWEIDLVTDTSFWSDELFDLLRIRKEAVTPSPELFLSFIHPDDFDWAHKCVMNSFTTLEDSSFQYRFIDGNGVIRHGHSDWRFEFDEDENPLRLFGIVQDITEHKKMELAFHATNDRLLFHIENSPLGFIAWDDKFAVTSFSKRAEEIFGWTEKEFIETQKSVYSMVYHEDLPWVSQQAEQLISGGVSRNRTQHRNCTKEGRVIWCQWFNSVMRDKNGKVITIMSLVQDITEQMKSLEQVEKLSLVASKINNGTVIMGSDRRIEWVNDGFTKLTKYALEEVVGCKPSLLYGPDTDKFSVSNMEKKLSRGQFTSVELINYSKTGQTYWMKIDTTPVFDGNGNLKKYISIYSDISELKEFESSITSIARELASLIENASVPVFGIDVEGNINEWNQVAAKLTGYCKHEVVGKPFYVNIPDQSAASVFKGMVDEVMTGISTKNLELPIITRNKKRLMLLVSASPRSDPRQEITGAIFVAQNITELTDYRSNLEIKVWERTKALNEALRNEKKVVEMKSRFVSIASHEFRTPLSTISINCGLLRKHQPGLSPQEIDSKLENIEKQVQHMTIMLDDVLMVEKADAGKYKVQKKDVGISDFFSQICKEVEKSEGHTHKISFTEDLLVDHLSSDERLLRSVCINLLTNAIKFSPGANQVDVQVISHTDHVCLTVTDRGIGIPQDDIEKLFDPFYRGGNVTAIPGTGLGLSIIKKALDMLNGNISIRSEVGRGTKIMVKIPAI